MKNKDNATTLANAVRKACNDKMDFRLGKEWATDFIDENGFSGIEDLYEASWEANTESNIAFNDGVAVVGMDAEILSAEDYMEFEEVRIHRAELWSTHNDGDVESQLEYFNDCIDEANDEINELRADTDALENKYENTGDE